jgi:Alkylmercury lyase
MSVFLIESEDKVQKAVDRLNDILPLKEKQSSLSSSMKQLHKDILFSYFNTGRSLTRNEIAEKVGDINEAVNILQTKDLVVFDASGEPIGAYPFTMEPRVHKLNVNGHQLQCMCALDSLAVSSMFDIEVEISSQCHVSKQKVSIKQKNLEFENIKELNDLYFGISWSSAETSSCCANSLCTEMIFLKGDDLAGNWQLEDRSNREIFDLDEAAEFSARFFMPLME